MIMEHSSCVYTTTPWGKCSQWGRCCRRTSQNLRCHPDLNGENRQQPWRQIADCLHLVVNRLLCLYQMAALAAYFVLIVSKKVAKLKDITMAMGVIIVSSDRVASYPKQLRLKRRVFLSHMKLKVENSFCLPCQHIWSGFCLIYYSSFFLHPLCCTLIGCGSHQCCSFKNPLI